MVQATLAATPSAVIPPAAATSVAISAASEASIAAYLAAGEQMRILAGWVAVALLAIVLALVVAWATGVLPASIRLY